MEQVGEIMGDGRGRSEYRSEVRLVDWLFSWIISIRHSHYSLACSTEHRRNLKPRSFWTNPCK
jgi:hypothetical protein